MLFWQKNKETSEKIPYKREIAKIHEVHESIKEMTKEELITYTEEARLDTNKDTQKIKAYAIAYEIIIRTLHVTPYDVQLAGGYALSEGNISQMKTGEGKTITALFPAFWGYVANLQTHVITVNEYLVERDHGQAQAVFNYLNIEVGLILKDMDTFQKKANYSKPVVYITNSEFAFDYLRDNIASNPELFMQGEFDFAVIDEADLVLIDEAKNPVIISSSSSENLPNMLKAKDFVLTLQEDDYEIDEEIFIPSLAEQGYDKAKEYFGYELTDNHDMFHAVRQSLMAYYKFKADVDYIVRDGEVMIVDKFTGRVLDGRRFQQGLHQAIEAKENVDIQPENVAVAMVTYQNLFRKFALISGMTGTGIESKKEFEEIYRMDVTVIPTNRPIARIDHNDVMFQSKKDKYDYLLELVKEKHEKGQPILIGTISVKESEEVSDILTSAHLSYQLLNAKNDKEESEIVEKAGEKGAITIATNMAGRGTDIKLTEDIEALGGLFVLGVSRNESKRIDRQLKGRSGRQGQRGESQFLTSIEDEFLVMYPTNKFEKFRKKNQEYPFTKEIGTKMIDDIQDVMDSQGISVRKFQFQMDEILHYQREMVYNMRKRILTQGLPMDSVKEKIGEISNSFIRPYNEESDSLSNWDMDTLIKDMKEKWDMTIPLSSDKKDEWTKKEYLSLIEDKLTEFLERLDSKVEKEEVDLLLKESAIEMIDKSWMNFLASLDEYKSGFGLSAFGEQDPIRKFSIDVDTIFKDLMAQAYVDFYATVIKRGDILLTVGTHSFFTVFPMKNQYLFKFNLHAKEETQVKSVLYGERSIVDEFKLIGTDDVVAVIPYQLNPGKYVIKNFVNGVELNRIGFKVIEEHVEILTHDASAMMFRLPVEEIHPVQDTVYKATLTHVISKETFEFEVPSTNEWMNIEKPENVDWMLGRYVFTLFGANLPLYHREYMVYPKEHE